jgi:hypothetical protein
LPTAAQLRSEHLEAAEMVKRVRTPKANRESTTRFPSSVTGIGGQAFVRFGICFHLAPIPFPQTVDY